MTPEDTQVATTEEIDKPTSIHNDHANTTEHSISEDDFGDFEEEDEGFGDFAELTEDQQENEDAPNEGTPTPEIITPKQSESITPRDPSVLVFNGDFDQSKEKINLILNGLLSSPLHQKQSLNQDAFKLDPRAETVYERLTQEPTNLKQVNWKKSLIKRQLYLTLQIPIDLDELSPSQARKKLSSTIYDDETTNSLNKTSEDELFKLIPQFDSLNIDNKDSLLSNTNATLETYFSKLQPFSYYTSLNEEDLGTRLHELGQIRDDLLRLLSCWNKKEEELKSDNHIFSSYVENLVGNTQKLRRKLDRIQ